jgi:hypothetical protein
VQASQRVLICMPYRKSAEDRIGMGLHGSPSLVLPIRICTKGITLSVKMKYFVYS